LAAKPELDIAVQILTNIGNVYSSVGDTENAIVAHQNALEISPRHWKSLAGLASIEEKRRNYSIAAGYLSECLRINPNLEEVGIQQLNGLSRCLFELGDYEAAYERINQALSIDPRDEYSRNLKMHILRKMSENDLEYVDETIEYFKNEILNGFQTHAARGELFFCYLMKEDRPSAKAVLEDLLSDGTTSIGAYFNYARILKEEGDAAGAIEHLKLAFQLEPAHHVAHNLGELLYAQCNYLEAAQYFKAALVGIKSQAQLLRNVAYCYHYSGNNLESLRYSAKAIIFCPQDHELWRDLMASYLQLEKEHYFSDLEELAFQVADEKGSLQVVVESLLSILSIEFGDDFTQSVTSCDLRQSIAESF